MTLSEVLATSDVPGGVVNLITGYKRELVPWLASHMDVNALDLFGVPPDLRIATEEAAVESMKRVARPRATRPRSTGWTTTAPSDRSGSRPSSR